MAPKAKAKAKAGAVAKAKAKAKAKAAPLAMAKAKARVRARGPGALRRPAPQLRGAHQDSIQDRWEQGQEVEASKLSPWCLSEGTKLVMDAAMYYHQECKVSAEIKGIEVKGGEVTLKVQLRGTTHEGLLKQHSGQPDLLFRLHLCPTDCNQEDVADTLLHTRKLRKMGDPDKEDGWVHNLQKVVPAEGIDELAALRIREQELLRAAPAGAGGPCTPPGEEKKTKKKKKKKEVKDSKKKRREDAERTSGSHTSEAKLDGTKSKAAAKKSPAALFSGTGLDTKERVRRRVSKRARQALRKKNKKDSSDNSEGTTSSSGSSHPDEGDEGVFQQSSKVKKLVFVGYPGVLAAQALSQMRTNLLAELGTEEASGKLRPCAVAYYKQQLGRKAVGPVQRELLTLAAAADLLLVGNAASAMDIMLQRFKSCESTLLGNHWSVSQRLEVAPQEGVSLTPLPEMGQARKDVYQEARMKWLTAQPDGRRSSTSNSYKGQSKGKAETKDAPKGGKDRRWGKGGPGKTDPNKKKEEGANKA